MGETYENKSIDTIKQDIKKEFKNIENSKRGRYRDDQEIYEAGEKIISKYISQLSNADGMRISNEKWGVKDGKAELIKSANLYKGEALKYFKDAEVRFKERRKEVLDEHGIFGMYITSSSENEKQIHEVAKAINTAEETALQKIKKVCNPKQEQHNTIEDSSIVRDDKGNVKVNNGEIVRQKPLYTQSEDGTIILTDKTNPIKIHQALGNLFKNKDKIYRIDYSNCANQKIKDKMQSLIGGLSCWIKYDKGTQTYTLTDKKGNILTNRALVWEGVALKLDSIMEGQDDENGGLTDEERSSLENLRSNSESFEFDANNYRYYEQYSAKHGNINICSSYAYGVVSDIFAKKGYCFTAPEVSAWEIADSSHIKGKFNVNKVDSDFQQQIVDAPAGSFFTVKYDKTSHQDRGVSHVIVSLGNGVYTDLFGPRIRKIDFKSDVTFSGNKFTYKGESYTITEDSRLMSPNIGSFPDGTKQTFNGENVTPDEFAKQIHESTGNNTNYIKSLIASQNNISADNFGKKVDNLSVKIITKQVTDLNLDNAGSNDVADTFLDSLKHHKRELMEHYQSLTNHEYDEIAKRAIGILYQESDAGDSLKYKGKEVVHDLTFSSLPGNRSRGYTQLKYNGGPLGQKDKEFLKKFGINNGSDLTDANKCGVATMVGLISNYENIVKPMQSDSFWRNDAEIIELKFNDGERESIAIGKDLRQPDGTRRPRTEEEIQAKIEKWSNEHGGIKTQKTIVREGIKNVNDFFDFLYYAWNKPSEITYGTATPSINNYISQSNGYIKKHTIDEAQNA